MAKLDEKASPNYRLVKIIFKDIYKSKVNDYL